MFGRIFLSLIFISSIAWIGYVGFDILNVKSNFSPNTVFSSEDGKIAILNRPNEIDFAQINRFDSAPMFSLVKDLQCSECIIFISFERAQLLIERNDNWSEDKIKQIFPDNYSLSFSGANFSVGEYDGRFFKSSLYLKKGDIQHGSKELVFDFDKKASASILTINSDAEINAVEDIYFLPNGKINYITHNENLLQGKQVKDEELFAGVVTNKFSSYHFFERDYYATIDSTFAKSTMLQWTLNGFIDLNYKGERAIISDYIDGQDPILILNDAHQTLDKNQFNDQLLNDFPTKGRSFYIKYLEDLVVMSESEATCDQIIADFKLGNTIALNEYVRNKLFGQLPKLVSERFVTADLTYSKAVYQGRILQTQLGASVEGVVAEKQETISMNCEFDVQYLVALRGNGNLVVQGKNGEIAFFEKGNLAWKTEVEQKIMGNIQVVDLYSNGELFTLFNTSEKLYLIDSQGKNSSGFPVSLEKEASNQVKFYRWKGKSYLLQALNGNQVLQLDGEGRELNIIKSKEAITEQIDVWASKNKLFAGFSNSDFFEMYNMEKNKSHRTFALPVKMQTTKIPNELIQFGIEDGHLIKIDQKGSKFKFAKFNNAKLLKVVNENKNPVILVKSANEIHLLNNEGIEFGLIHLPFNEVDDVTLTTSNSGKTTIAVVDGLENNVYLYRANGELITPKALEGQKTIQLNKSNSSLRVTTVVDQFIVQYFN